MRPAATTVLRHVLVERMRQVANAIDIGPVKVVRQARRFDVRVGLGRGVVVVHGVVADLWIGAQEQK